MSDVTGSKHRPFWSATYEQVPMAKRRCSSGSRGVGNGGRAVVKRPQDVRWSKLLGRWELGAGVWRRKRQPLHAAWQAASISKRGVGPMGNAMNEYI